MQQPHRPEANSGNQHCLFIHGNLACKELSQRWLCKKASWIWNLIILILVGMCGIYMCISGVEQHTVYQKTKRVLPTLGKNEAFNFCSSANLHFLDNIPVHYPQPVTYDRQECRCTPVHNFVILSMQRSGSGWFETLLNSHPNVSSHGEVFSIELRRENASTIKKNLDSLYNLDWFSSASKNECTAAVGMKWMLNQGVMEYQREVAAYFRDHKVSIIFLFRRNILKRYVSILANAFDRDAKQLNGTHRAHVHSKDEANVLALFRPVVNLTSLINYLNHVEEIIHDAQVSFDDIRHMVVYYEDLVKNPQELIRAQEFLGVETKRLESKHVKIHTRPLHDQVKNWAGLSSWLKGTKYESFLNGKDYR